MKVKKRGQKYDRGPVFFSLAQEGEEKKRGILARLSSRSSDKLGSEHVVKTKWD